VYLKVDDPVENRTWIAKLSAYTDAQSLKSPMAGCC